MSRALITLDPTAGEDPARGRLGGTHTCCLIQPCYDKYFPVVTSLDNELPLRLAVELSQQGTLVVAVHVSFIDTDMSAGLDVPKISPE